MSQASKGMLIAVAVVALSVSAAIAQESESMRRLITVTGDAEIKVPPDLVVITLGVETLDMAVEKSKKENDRLIADFTAVAKKNGIEALDIQTDYINIEPFYDRPRDERRFLGYQVRRRIMITLKDISKFDILLSSLIEAGATQIKGVEFQTTELRKYRDQARTNAITAAREKATLLAGELGQKIGKAWSIDERNSNWRSWYDYYNSWSDYHSPNSFNSQNVVNVPSSSEYPDAIGKISVTASVTVKFELE